MVITSHYPQVPINFANPPTELAKRDSALRERVEPSPQTFPPHSERPPASDKERARPGAEPDDTSARRANVQGESNQQIQGRGEGDGENAGNDEQGREQQGQQQQQQQDEQRVRELARRDSEVRAHELAHQSSGGQYASSPTYEYQRGPDGKRYAVGGEVQIDTSLVSGNPQASLAKMETVLRAALAPAQPSAQDRRVAAQASSRLVELRGQVLQAEMDKLEADEGGQSFSQSGQLVAANNEGAETSGDSFVLDRNARLQLDAETAARRDRIQARYQGAYQMHTPSLQLSA